MDAKTFLRQIRLERTEIRILERKIREKQYELLPGAIRYDTDKVNVTPEDRFSETIAEIADYEDRLKKYVRKLVGRQTRALKAIARIQSPEQRLVLEEYYLSPDNPTWDKVADRLSYSRRAVLNYHGEALKNLNKQAAFGRK